MGRAILATVLLVVAGLLLVLLLPPGDVDDAPGAALDRPADGRTAALPRLRGSAPTAEERLDARPDGEADAVPEGVGRAIEPDAVDVVGRVVGADGASLRGARVEAFVDGPDGERESLGSVGTAALGRFWLRLARSEERVHLLVEPPPHAEAPYAPTVVRDVATASRGEVVELRPGVWIEGEIVDPAGAPVAGARLVHRPVDAPPSRARRLETDGTFRIAVAPGRHRVFADPRRRDLTCTPMREVRAPVADLRLVCLAGVRVRGRLRGGGVEGFRIGWSRAVADGAARSGTTLVEGPDGRFDLEHVPPEAVTLYAWRADDERYALRVVDATATIEHALELVPGLAIEGVIVGERSLDHVRHLNVWDRQLFVWRNVRVRVDDTFVVRGLPPGAYDLGVVGVGRRDAVPAGSTGVRIVATAPER